jgi:membrane fusion protein (multidrug efflux system)
MALKKIHTVVAVVGIALLGGGAWWLQRFKAPTPDATGAQTRTAEGARAAAPAGPSGQRGPGGPGGAGGPGGGPVAVELGKVTAIRIEDDAQAVGTVRAAQSVVVRPEVSGRIMKIGFAEGQPVRRGQLLVQFDDKVQAAQLQQAQAQAAIARTNLQRSRELLAQNFVSQAAVDQNAAALEVAQSQVALAQAQLARLRILSPFDGVAGIKQVNVGDYVKDGADLVTLEDRSRMWVDFRLPERYLSDARTGLPVEVVVDALPGEVYKATVQALDAQVDANGRALLVRARLEQAPKLRSGMFARTRVVFAVRDKALVVPEEALVPQGGKQYLVKAVDAPASGAANNGPPGKLSQRIEARLGVRKAGQVEILQGLAEGDLVVTAGHGRLMRGDGLPLRVVDVDNPRGPAKPAKPASGAASGVASKAPV